MESKKINGIRHYKLPDGQWVMSVSSIVSIGAYSEPPFLKASLSTPAMDRGTKVHEIIESLLLGLKRPVNPDLAPYVKSVEPLLSEMTPLRLEQFIWHPDGYAGRLDAIVQWQGKTTIVDWKTTALADKFDIRNAEVQLAAYRSGAAHCGMPIAEQGAIVLAHPNGPAVVKTISYHRMAGPLYREFLRRKERAESHVAAMIDVSKAFVFD